MAAPPTAEQIREVNTRYHDVAAAEYDAKWGIDFGDIGRAQVLRKVRKLLGRDPGPFEHSLEIGVGHGLLHAEPDAGRDHRRGHLHATSPPACSRRWRPTPSGSGST